MAWFINSMKYVRQNGHILKMEVGPPVSWVDFDRKALALVFTTGRATQFPNITWVRIVAFHTKWPFIVVAAAFVDDLKKPT